MKSMVKKDVMKSQLVQNIFDTKKVQDNLHLKVEKFSILWVKFNFEKTHVDPKKN